MASNEKTVEQWLNAIKTAIYGEEVRESIWQAISACYKDVHNRELITDGINTVLKELIAEGLISDDILETVGVLTEKTENMFDATKIISGRLQEVDGKINTSETNVKTYRTSEYIQVFKNRVYFISNTTDRCFYDSGKNYIRKTKPTEVNSRTGAGWTAPDNGFIRVSVNIDNVATASIYVDERRSTYISGRTAVDAKLRDSVYTKDVTDSKYVPYPSPNDLGQSGQVLRSTGTGTEWVTPASPTSTQVNTAVQTWLNDHPEATTTVADGAVTTDKVAPKAVTSDKMADDSVTPNALANGAVETDAVADNAITSPKLGTDVRDILARIGSSSDITVVPTFDEATATTTEYVLVEHDGVHDDGFVGSGGPCLYRHWDGWGERSVDYVWDINQGNPRSDGTYIFPVPDQGELVASNPPMDDICKVIQSYIEQSRPILANPIQTKLRYNNQATLYSENVTIQSGTYKNSFGMDCSSFVSAVLQGVSFKNSRYNLGKNAENIMGSYVGPHFFPTVQKQSGRTHSLKAGKMAEWFAAHKQLFTYEHIGGKPADILKPGDIFFTNLSAEQENSEELSDTSYFSIDHVGIVIQTFPRDGIILMAQCGACTDADNLGYNLYKPQGEHTSCLCNFVFLDVDKLYDRHFAQVFARPAYGGGRSKGQEITGGFRSKSVTINTQSDTAMTTFGYIASSKGLKPNTIYTVEIEGTGLPSYKDNGSFMVVRCFDPSNEGENEAANGTTSGQAFETSVNNGRLSLTFVTDNTVVKGMLIKLAVLPKDFNSEVHSSFTPSITGAVLYEGPQGDGGMMERLGFSKNETEVKGSTNRSYIKDGICFVDLGITLNGSARTGDINLGTFGTNWPGTISNTVMYASNGTNLVRITIGIDGSVTVKINNWSGTLVYIQGILPVRALAG